VIKPGDEWGKPATGPAEVDVTGGDADLATAVADRPGVRVSFHPDSSSDLAGAVGLGSRPLHDLEVPLDLLRLDDGRTAANMIVLGSPPDEIRRFARRFGASVRVDNRPVFHGPCRAVVIATGQFRRGLDIVPRGHPGDGRAEIQVYAVRDRDLRALRRRLATGTHVPHPEITQRTGSRVTVTTGRKVGLEIDRKHASATDFVELTVVPDAYRLLL
jgi:YegS C-terminal NAD kinase beta sandwich-like domain